MLARTASTTPATATAAAATAAPGTDNSLYIRPVRPELPGAVRHGFIPEEWFVSFFPFFIRMYKYEILISVVSIYRFRFTFFYKKTGVTGPYTFTFALFTYLASKEIYVMEHEFYGGLSFAILLIVGIKKLGPGVKKALDDEIDQIEANWAAGRNAEIKSHEDSIEMEKKEQWRAEGQVLLNDAKKENVALQLEAAYRERLANVFAEVKRRLDYQVAVQQVERQIKQKHLVNWVHSKVLASITADQDKETLNRCIADLGALAKA